MYRSKRGRMNGGVCGEGLAFDGQNCEEIACIHVYSWVGCYCLYGVPRLHLNYVVWRVGVGIVRSACRGGNFVLLE